MLHILKYRAKCMFMNRPLMFWTLLFPLILTTLFGAVLRHAYDLTTFETISIAMIDNTAYQKNTTLQKTLKSLRMEDTPMFKVQEVSTKKGKQLLQKGDVDAMITIGDETTILVKETGIKQTMTQNFFDEYTQNEHMAMQLLAAGSTPEQLMQTFTNTHDYIKTNNEENTNLSCIFFYTLLAMNALFGGYWAINSMYSLQANQSTTAARIAIAPTHKGLNLFIDLFLNIVFQMTILSIVFFYMYTILQVDFGNQLGFVVLAIFMGVLAGNGLGLLIGILLPQKDIGTKTGVLTSITMLGSFLAGMMMVQMKYLVQVHAPILAYINPVNMVTDALYSLYYYGVGERYYLNLFSLLIFSLLCYLICYRSLRKTRYQSLGVQ